MSYARWGEHSNVYVFAHYLGFVECCACLLGEPEHQSVESITNHMQEHVEAGHLVPPYLLEQDTYDPQDFVRSEDA